MGSAIAPGSNSNNSNLGGSGHVDSPEGACASTENLKRLPESGFEPINCSSPPKAHSLPQASSRFAEHGENEIAKLISAMGEIASGSKKIEDIINVIEQISKTMNQLDQATH